MIESWGIISERFITEISAITDSDRIRDDRRSGGLHLIAGIPFGAGPADLYITVAGMIKQVDTVGSIMTDIAAVENPISIGLGHAQTVAIAALRLTKTIIRLSAGISFAASVKRHFHSVEHHSPVIRRIV